MSDIKQLANKALTAWSACRKQDGNIDMDTCEQAAALETVLFSAIEIQSAELTQARATIESLRTKLAELQARIDTTEKQEPLFWYREGDDTAFVRGDLMQGFIKPLYTHPSIPPEGMMLVPVEPTEAMAIASLSNVSDKKRWITNSKKIYKAMLSAVPAEVE
jgi:hypothetical protein